MKYEFSTESILKMNRNLILGFSTVAVLLTGTSFSWFSFTPPGTKKLSELNIFLDQKEVTNFGWTEMMIYLHKHEGPNSEAFRTMQPNSTLWRKTYGRDFDCFRMIKTEASDQPIIGITHKQASMYCIWRSERVSDISGRKVTYMLPTRSAIEQLLSLESSERSANTEPLLVSKAKRTGKFYGLFTNVDEFLAEEHVVLSGMDVVNRTSAHRLVGFRCMAVVEP